MQTKVQAKYWVVIISILPPALSHFLGTNGKLLQYLNKLNAQPLSQTIETILIVLFWLSILSVAWLIYLLNKIKLKPRFGLYWDKENNPYCPSCKSLLSNYYEDSLYSKIDPHFICIKCGSNKPIHIRDENGNRMHLYQAVYLLKYKNVTPELIEKSIQKGKQPL